MLESPLAAARTSAQWYRAEKVSIQQLGRVLAQHVDRAAFQKFVLSLFPFGIYASPSAALHSIVTLAHTDDDVDRTLEAAGKALER